MYYKFLLIPVIVALIALYCDLTTFKSLSELFQSKPSPKNLFTSDTLKQYNGIDKPELYLAILGNVFDVSKGATHYGAGCAYNFFTGRDASRSFVTGQFGENDANDQVADLSPEDLRSLNHWIGFYGKEYHRVGKLIGRYYDENGKLTKYGKAVKRLIKAAEQEKEAADLDKVKFPPCNVEWDAERGTRVWCTDKSGGVSRDWVGVPRQLYEPGSQDYRCACVATTELSGSLKQYEGCDSDSDSCFVK